MNPSFAFESSSNAEKPTSQYTDSCTQGKARARHSREASSLPHDLPLSPTPNRPGVCLRVRCGMVLRVTGLRLRVRRVRRAEMPSALRRSKHAGAYIYVTVVATYTHHCPGRAHWHSYYYITSTYCRKKPTISPSFFRFVRAHIAIKVKTHGSYSKIIFLQ